MIKDIEVLEKIDKKVFQYIGRADSIYKNVNTKFNFSSTSVGDRILEIAKMLQLEEHKYENE